MKYKEFYISTSAHDQDITNSNSFGVVGGREDLDFLISTLTVSVSALDTAMKARLIFCD